MKIIYAITLTTLLFQSVLSTICPVKTTTDYPAIDTNSETESEIIESTTSIFKISSITGYFFDYPNQLLSVDHTITKLVFTLSNSAGEFLGGGDNEWSVQTDDQTLQNEITTVTIPDERTMIGWT